MSAEPPTPAPATRPLEPDDPRELGGYRIEARIGAGGMGLVYLGATQSGRQLAIKVIRSEYAREPEFRTRFGREVAAALKVRGPSTAVLVDADPDASQPWLATEYVPGPTLTRAVMADGPLPEARVRAIVGGVAEALHAVHRADLVHRDLKPSNVLLGPDGPYVIDMGIARAADATSLTTTGLQIGTPMYMAPEQAGGEVATAASDVWALGALALFAATGHAPFGDGPSAAVLYRVVHEEPRLDGCPDYLRPLVEACLAKDPAERPSVQAILGAQGDWGALAGSTGATATQGEPTRLRAEGQLDATQLRATAGQATAEPESSTSSGPRRRRRTIAWVTAGSVALLGVGVASAIALQPWGLGTKDATPRAAQLSAERTDQAADKNVEAAKSPSPSPPASSPDAQVEDEGAPAEEVEAGGDDQEAGGPAALRAFAAGTVALGGNAVYGQTLTATAAGWNPAPDSATCVWFEGDVRLSTGGSCSLLLDAAQVGHTYRAELTGHRSGYKDASAASGRSAVVEKATMSVAEPAVIGELRVGAVVECAVDRVDGASYAVSWHYIESPGVHRTFGQALQATLPASAERHTVYCLVSVEKSGYHPVEKRSALRPFDDWPEPD